VSTFFTSIYFDSSKDISVSESTI